MTRRLRDHPDELEVYVTRIAASTGIPAAHLEKDFWVTEVLRGAANASASTGCSVIFKGGTSLSKVHRMIRRFSEDVDLIVVLPEGGTGMRDTTLKAFVAAAETATGIESTVDHKTVTKGVKRTTSFAYPTSHQAGGLKPGVLMEIGTRGGALPNRRLPIQSLIAEHAETIELPVDFEEATPTSLRVLDPVRTLVEKLVLLHHAATDGDERRQTLTARHYYDIDRLLRDDTIMRHSPHTPSMCSPEKSPNTPEPLASRPQIDLTAASPPAPPGTPPPEPPRRPTPPSSNSSSGQAHPHQPSTSAANSSTNAPTFCSDTGDDRYSQAILTSNTRGHEISRDAIHDWVARYGRLATFARRSGAVFVLATRDGG